MTGRAAHQVGYLARLASRAAPAQSPAQSSLRPLQSLQPLQPSRSLFAGMAYRLDGPPDHALDPGLGLPGEDGLADPAAGGAAGAATAKTAPSGRAEFPAAATGAPGTPVLLAPPGTAPAAGAAAGPLGTAALPGRAAPEGTGAPPGTAAPEGKPAAAGEVAVLGPATPGLPEADPSVLRPAGAAPSVPGAAWAAPAGLTDAGNAGPAWGRTTGAGGPDAGSSRPTAPSAASLPAAGLTPLPPHPAAPGSGPGRGEVTGRDLTARPPAPGWLWGTPVELPERGSVADGAGRPPSGTLPPGDGQELIGTQAGGERAGLVRDLLPPSAGAGRSGEQAGTGRSARQAPARVTIGTIEVTVVPPARPAHGAAGPALVPPLPAAPQPASQLAEAGAVWLRDGLRRWYGIAQG